MECCETSGSGPIVNSIFVTTSSRDHASWDGCDQMLNPLLDCSETIDSILFEQRQDVTKSQQLLILEWQLLMLDRKWQNDGIWLPCKGGKAGLALQSVHAPSILYGSNGRMALLTTARLCIPLPSQNRWSTI